MTPLPRISIVGLGYVGLPLAVALARHFSCIGLDISTERIEDLKRSFDRTREVDANDLQESSLRLTTSVEDCRGSDLFIVTVPTPVDAENRPDLKPLIAASRSVGSILEKNRRQIVIYESTVYPGVTEDICGRALEEVSGLICGNDFFLAYSPERINPGDREHTVGRITKVVAGQTPEVLERVAEVYGRITSGGVFRAASIKVAEAAKVIENTQRDINIAFVNEISMIFQKMGISVHDVLEAAGTKWNFLKFSPGLVGGHCIGVDPYYLAHRAVELDHNPEVILAGRRINDGMGRYVADCVHRRVSPRSRILVLGLTFKENVPDLRNSKVVDVIRRLEQLGHSVVVHDPLADRDAARKEYGLELLSAIPSGDQKFDAVVGAVSHREYAKIGPSEIARLLAPGGLLADVKGIWRGVDFPETVQRWQL